MPVPFWPASLPLRPRTQSLNGGPRRMVASFEPEQGVEQTRPRVTAAVHVLSFETPALDAAQMVTLRSFFEDTLRGGSIPFSWLDPRTNEAWLWKPVPGDGPYKETDLGGGFSQVSLTLVRQPGRPWYYPYMLPGQVQPPLLVADFQNGRYGRNGDAESFTDVINFVRGGVGTYVGSDGLVKTTAVGQPRIDADGLNRDSARFNNVLKSEQFDDATWTKSNTTVSANADVAPDGNSTADKLIPTTAVANHVVSQSNLSVILAEEYEYSCFFKADGYGWVRVSIGGGFATNYAFFDLTTGAIGTVAGQTDVKITQYPNGWWRVSGHVAANATTTAANVAIYLLNADSFTAFGGDGVSGILTWGFQFTPTNLIVNGSALDTGSWAKTRVTVTPNLASVAPDGTTTAEGIVPTTEVNNHFIAQTFSRAKLNKTYRLYGYFKAGGFSWVSLQTSLTLITASVRVNLVTGAVGGNSGFTNISVTDAGNGWWRVSMDVVSQRSQAVGINVLVTNGDTTAAFAGNGTSQILAWGISLEELDAPQVDYIPTNTVAVLRNNESSGVINTIGACTFRTVDRDGVVTDTVYANFVGAPSAWPLGVAAGARSIIAYPPGTI